MGLWPTTQTCHDIRCPDQDSHKLPWMKCTVAFIKLPGPADPLHNLTNFVDPIPKVILIHGPLGQEMLHYTTVPVGQVAQPV